MPLSQRLEQVDAQATSPTSRVVIRRVDDVGKVLIGVDVAFPRVEVILGKLRLVEMEVEIVA